MAKEEDWERQKALLLKDIESFDIGQVRQAAAEDALQPARQGAQFPVLDGELKGRPATPASPSARPSSGNAPAAPTPTTRVDFNASSAAADFARPQPARLELRVAVASMLNPEDIYDVYGDLVEYLGDKVQRKPRVIQRTTYREINDLLVAGETDLGFIGTGSYLQLSGTGKVDALVVPVGQRQLFLDGHVIGKIDGLHSTMHSPEKRGAVIKPDAASDGSRVQTYGTVPKWSPEEGLFKTVYMAFPMERTTSARSWS